jgi:hypothetical protein
VLTWTSDATFWDIRYSNTSIATENEWNVSQQCLNETASPFNVTGLAPNTTYYFRMKAAYHIGWWNNMSNQDWDTTVIDYCPFEEDYDFSYMCDDKSAYESDVDKFPFEGVQGNRNTYDECGESVEGKGGYEDIDADDENEWITSDPDVEDYMITWWHMFIDGSVEDITKIRFRWKGASGGGTTSHIMWVLKDAGRNEWWNDSYWTQLGASVPIFENQSTDIIRWINTSNYSIGDYVNATTGQITFVIENSGRANEIMRTDYVEMKAMLNPVCDDKTAPAPIGNLNATTNSGISIDLDWIAPGDDNILGLATGYDIRYSTSGQITESNWDDATQVTNEQAPNVAGTLEEFTVSGLNRATKYWFAIKTRDEVPLWSGISSSPVAKTAAGWPSEPGPVRDLAAAGTCKNVKLTWSAPADNGYGGGSVSSYDIRYSSSGPIDTKTAWDAATKCTGEPVPQAPGSTETFNQTFQDANADTTYWFAIKSFDGLYNSSLSLTTPSAKPNHGELRGTEWWLWHIYYNSEEGSPETNSVYHIASVRAVNQSAFMNYSALDNPDVCGFQDYTVDGCAVIDWSCDQAGRGTLDPTRERRVDTGLGAGLSSELMMDSEMYVDEDDATLWVDANALPWSFQTYYGIGDGVAPTDHLFSYQDNDVPADDAYPPGPYDGYPFVVGEGDWKQWRWTLASGDDLPGLGDQEQEKGFRWHVDSLVADYDVDASSEASAATGVFDVVLIERTNNYFKTYDPTYGQNNSADPDTTQYWYNCSVKNFVRLLDKITYAGREDWGIVEYETRNISASINEFSDAGSGFNISVAITNNEDKGGNFSVLALVMNMSAINSSTGEPYPGGETIYPNMSSISSINEAIEYTGNLASGASTNVTWTNVGDSSGTPQYKLWVTGATETIN